MFTCKEIKVPISNLNASLEQIKKNKSLTDMLLVVTESVFLVLETDHKIKNVVRLVAWASLGALESVKRNLEKQDILTFTWRQQPGDDKE